MRIAFVTNELLAEPTGGASVKTAAVASALARHGDTTAYAIAPGRPPGTGAIRSVWGEEIRRVGVAADALAAALDRAAPDLVVADDLSLGAVVHVPAGARLVVHVHSVDAPILLDEARLAGPSTSAAVRAGTQHRARLARLAERAAIRRAAQLWCVCDDDRDLIVASGANPAAVRVVPNIARPVTTHASPSDGRTVGFVGQLWYGPNRDAVVQLGAMARRQRDAGRDWDVTIAGLGADDALAGEVEPARLLGYVPRIEDAFAAMAVNVVPLRYGGGTKVKMLDALMHGAAIVSTPEGVRGLEGIVDGVHLLVRELGEPFEDAVESLLGDPARRADLGRAARALAGQRWSFDVLEAAVASALAELRGGVAQSAC